MAQRSRQFIGPFRPRKAAPVPSLVEMVSSAGAGAFIASPATILGGPFIRLGSHVTINARSFLSVIGEEGDDEKLVIGDRVTIGFDAVIACVGKVVIENDVLAADRIFIGDSYHDYRDPTVPIAAQPMAPARPVRIGAGSFIGIGAAILPGVSLGRNAYIGANAVVTQDVPDNCVVVGNPARVVRRWDGQAWLAVRQGSTDSA